MPDKTPQSELLQRFLLLRADLYSQIFSGPQCELIYQNTLAINEDPEMLSYLLNIQNFREFSDDVKTAIIENLSAAVQKDAKLMRYLLDPENFQEFYMPVRTAIIGSLTKDVQKNPKLMGCLMNPENFKVFSLDMKRAIIESLSEAVQKDAVFMAYLMDAKNFQGFEPYIQKTIISHMFEDCRRTLLPAIPNGTEHEYTEDVRKMFGAMEDYTKFLQSGKTGYLAGALGILPEIKDPVVIQSLVIELYNARKKQEASGTETMEGWAGYTSSPKIAVQPKSRTDIT